MSLAEVPLVSCTGACVWRYGVTYRSKFSLGIFPIEKLIFVSEIN